MKPNKTKIAKITKAIESDAKSIRQFQSQLTFYETKIRHGNDNLPILKKQIKEIESGLPTWKEQARIFKLSLKTHQERSAKQKVQLELLIQKHKILAKLHELDIKERTAVYVKDTI